MTTIASADDRVAYERAHPVAGDLDLEPVNSEDEDYSSAPAQYNIITYPADFTLEVLHQKWLAHEFDIPDFQRDFVWKQSQSSKLIESFLIGLPVPPVFLYKDIKSEQLLVIDGQQRLKSIFYYFEGYFGGGSRNARSVFRLKNLSPDSSFANKHSPRWEKKTKNASRTQSFARSSSSKSIRMTALAHIISSND